jgi:hypothetical protein
LSLQSAAGDKCRGACKGSFNERNSVNWSGVPNPRTAGWGVEAAESKLLRRSQPQGVVANLLRQDTEAWVKQPFLHRLKRL